jgi:hypothetical protein
MSSNNSNDNYLCVLSQKNMPIWPKKLLQLFLGIDTLPHIENYDGDLLFVMLEEHDHDIIKLTMNQE